MTAQDHWPDGSVRWLLVEGHLPGHVDDLALVEGPADGATAALLVTAHDGGWRVSTGVATIGIGRRGVLGVERVDVAGGSIDLSTGGFEVIDATGATARVDIANIRLVRGGPCAVVFEFDGRVLLGGRPLNVFGEVECFAGAGTVRVRVTLHNPRAATHPNGHFDLGSPHSLSLRSATMHVPLAEAAGAVLDCGDGTSYAGRHVRLHQESSGGLRWNHHTHVDATRRVPLAYRGFRGEADGRSFEGLRATPILQVVTRSTSVSVAVPRFWQNFPKGLAVTPGGVEIALFPEMALGPHELQGGEQKTHEVVLNFAPGNTAEPGDSHPLEWVRSPRLVHARPDYYASSGAFAGLVPKAQSTNQAYEGLVDAAIEGPDSFDAKREAVDEYGWRHFGDIWGDHEAVFYDGPDAPLVSHYNNQYDPVQGCAFQFLRSGDPRWWRHMDELAAHVVDIDVYHTDEDKSAYNHGLFWHTAHYIDADTSTHRAYPKRGSGGGGPSGGHLYPSGLVLHGYLTGSRASHRTALELADYVISCDDGRRTFMKWLSRAPTGVATASGSEHYHGPGRAPANSLNALLEGLHLTGDARFERKIDEILRRVFHPRTDVASLDLLDAENKWFYMMYAHSLGKYLDWCVEEGQTSESYQYARACFLHLMRWSVRHERPYLDKPEALEYPTETWAAQDMRKCDVFLAAARHAASEAERSDYVERARFFFEYSTSALEAFPTRTLCRPVVLLLSFGWRWFGEQDALRMLPPTPLPERDWGSPTVFIAQKTLFLQRARWLALGCAAAGVSTVVLILSWLWQA